MKLIIPNCTTGLGHRPPHLCLYQESTNALILLAPQTLIWDKVFCVLRHTVFCCQSINWPKALLKVLEIWKTEDELVQITYLFMFRFRWQQRIWPRSTCCVELFNWIVCYLVVSMLKLFLSPSFSFMILMFLRITSQLFVEYSSFSVCLIFPHDCIDVVHLGQK